MTTVTYIYVPLTSSHEVAFDAVRYAGCTTVGSRAPDSAENDDTGGCRVLGTA